MMDAAPKIIEQGSSAVIALGFLGTLGWMMRVFLGASTPARRGICRQRNKVASWTTCYGNF